MLVETTERAMAHCGSREVLIVGGVGCNIEDPFDKDDWSGYAKLTKETDIQMVGEDLIVTIEVTGSIEIFDIQETKEVHIVVEQWTFLLYLTSGTSFPRNVRNVPTVPWIILW